ncbi:MAG TPA: carbohydrate kinase [Burkholderiaceae bacterium]
MDQHERPVFPEIVSFGEALTDMIRTGDDHWLSKEGGGPWNMARAVAALGVGAAFGGAISQDWFGDAIWRTSAQSALDLRFLQRVAKAPLLAMVYQTDPPAYTFVGNDSADLAFDPAALPQGWEEGAAFAHFGGISLARAPLSDTLVALAVHLKQQGVRISYDPNFRALMTPAYDPVLQTMAGLADVIKVSDEDLVGLFRTADPDAGLAALRQLNPDAVILLTEGARGASLHAAGQSWRVAAPPVSVIDSVGAGDASIAGLLYSLLRRADQPWQGHLRFAVACGSAACLNAGATPPSLAQVETALRTMV